MPDSRVAPARTMLRLVVASFWARLSSLPGSHQRLRGGRGRPQAHWIQYRHVAGVVDLAGPHRDTLPSRQPGICRFSIATASSGHSPGEQVGMPPSSDPSRTSRSSRLRRTVRTIAHSVETRSLPSSRAKGRASSRLTPRVGHDASPICQPQPSPTGSHLTWWAASGIDCLLLQAVLEGRSCSPSTVRAT
jgi:hypothetical protein